MAEKVTQKARCCANCANFYNCYQTRGVCKRGWSQVVEGNYVWRTDICPDGVDFEEREDG